MSSRNIWHANHGWFAGTIRIRGGGQDHFRSFTWVKIFIFRFYTVLIAMYITAILELIFISGGSFSLFEEKVSLLKRLLGNFGVQEAIFIILIDNCVGEMRAIFSKFGPFSLSSTSFSLCWGRFSLPRKWIASHLCFWMPCDTDVLTPFQAASQ